jgi:hypothetical protein
MIDNWDCFFMRFSFKEIVCLLQWANEFFEVGEKIVRDFNW